MTPGEAAVDDGLVEGLEAVEGVRLMLGALAEVLEEPGVRGLEALAVLGAQLFGKILADERVGIERDLAGPGTWGVVATVRGPPQGDEVGLVQAVQQARRASEVVQRLRRVVERPDPAAGQQSVDLHETVRNALHLLEPELQRRSIRTEVLSALPGVRVLADPVALEQIVHNLVMNALQALEQVPMGERRLTPLLPRAPHD